VGSQCKATVLADTQVVVPIAAIAAAEADRTAEVVLVPVEAADQAAVVLAAAVAVAEDNRLLSHSSKD
jgi:hypothetical protein